MMFVGSTFVNWTRRSGLLGLMALGWARSSAAGPGPVLRALIESWPPYLEADDNGTLRGLDAELFQAICKQAGFELRWIRASEEWRKRRYLEFLGDQFDVIFAATPVPDNADAALYSLPYRDEVMMVAAPVPHDSSLDSLRGFEDLLRRRIRLLHVASYGLGKDFEAFRTRLRQAELLVPYSTSRQGIEMLRVGRAPLIIGDALDLRAQARISGLRLVQQAYGYSVSPVSLMLSRKRLGDEGLDRINQAIQALEQRGTLAAIRRRYGMPR